MKGTILDYNPQNQNGLIAGEDGKRYVFVQHDWKNNIAPQNGQEVDFSPAGERAGEIYRIERPLLFTSSKKLPATLLAFFLGSLGVHKLFLGYTREGIIMLLCFFPGMLLFGIPTIIAGVIGLVECIIYACKPDEDFERIYVQGRRPWF